MIVRRLLQQSLRLGGSARLDFAAITKAKEAGQSSKATNFYRNSIRRVNVKKSTQRGKFSEHTLLHLVKIARAGDLEVLFEAYYNYMGHFTIYSDKTVDQFMLSILRLAQKNEAEAPIAESKLIELLRHHDYLRYFPHYKVTEKCAEFFHQRGSYMEFIKIIDQKVLIKVDKDLYIKLISKEMAWEQFDLLVKAGAGRLNFRIIDGLDRPQLAAIIADRASKFDSISTFHPSRQFKLFLQSFTQKEYSEELAICFLLGKDTLDESIRILSSLADFKLSQSVYAKVARKLCEGSDSDILDRIQKEVEGTHLADLLEG